MKTKMVFVTTQLLFTMVAMIPTYHLWRHPTAHLIYIALIFAISVFYGASYYVEVFSKRYTLALERAADKAIARQRTSRSNSNASLSQSLSGGRLDQGGGVNSIPPAATGPGAAANEINTAAAGQEEDFEGTDGVEGTDSFDDYEEEFSLNNIWDKKYPWKRNSP